MTETVAGTEEWRDVPGYEGAYRVSSTGLVASVGRRIPHSSGHTAWMHGATLKPSHINHTMAVGLSRDGELHTFGVGCLVLMAFVGPRPPGMLAVHWNGDETDNRPGNLFWGTKDDVGLLRHERNEDAKRKARLDAAAPAGAL